MSSSLYCFIFVIVIVGGNASSNSSSLPSCKVKNSDVNECLKTYLQSVVKYAKHANPKYGIPTLDPYFLPKFVIPPFGNDGINLDMKNTSIYGFSKAKFNKVHCDPANGQFELQYTTPTTSYIGQYNLTGKLFSIPINGKGKYETNLMNLLYTVKVKGDVKENSDGTKYLHVKTASAHMKPQLVKGRFDQLFRNNKQLTDLVNQMMNDNWQEMYGKFQPKMEEEMSKHLFKVSTDFFKLAPYNEMFPDV